jgi:hypothetical protein
LRREGKDVNISRLKELNVDRILDIDEAVALSAEAREMEAEYEALEIPAPEWLEKSTNVLRCRPGSVAGTGARD